MPFDPDYPQNGDPLDAEPMRAQLLALKALIDALTAELATRPTHAEVADAISAASSTTLGSALTASSNNTNAVDLINQTPLDPPTSNDVMIAYSKINELLNTARRT